jgi:xanthine/CO dehydrogenase XdhC/CoxF family maturation factor
VKDIYDILSELKRCRGEKFALATLVHGQGSSYRRRGPRSSFSAADRKARYFSYSRTD